MSYVKKKIIVRHSTRLLYQIILLGFSRLFGLKDQQLLSVFFDILDKVIHIKCANSQYNSQASDRKHDNRIVCKHGKKVHNRLLIFVTGFSIRSLMSFEGDLDQYKLFFWAISALSFSCSRILLCSLLAFSLAFSIFAFDNSRSSRIRLLSASG